MIPNWIAMYPNVASVAGTTASFNVQIDIDGVAYFVVLPNNAVAPSSAQVKAGTDSNDAPLAAGFFGSVVLTGNTLDVLNASNLISETDYDVYVVAEDTTPDLQAAPTLLEITTTDITAPVWEATYPKSGVVAGTTAEILVQTTEDSTAYFVAVASGDPAPSSAQVKAGTDSTDTPVAVGFLGSVALTANVEGTLNASNLVSETDYDIYVVAEDASLNLQAVPELVQITTTDITGPNWVGGYPNVVTVGAATAQVALEIDEDGTGYYVVLPNGDPAPSISQVKAGTDSTDTPVVMSGNLVLTANVEGFINLSGLTSETQYDIYIVAEDVALNSSILVQLDITTLDMTEPDWTATYPVIDQVTINTANVLVSMIEAGTVYGVAVPKGSVAPTVIQVRNGTDSDDVVLGSSLAPSVAVTADTEFVLSFTDLMINKDYEVYVVGEDSSNNLMANVVKIGFTTLPLIRSQKMMIPSVEVGQIWTVNINSLNVVTTKSFPEIFKIAVFPGDGYEIVQLGEKSFDIKISGTFSNMTREVIVKVGDGIVVSDEFKYKLQVVQASRPKEKPISYGGTNVTPPDPFTPAFRRV